jgi:hypothetical protein
VNEPRDAHPHRVDDESGVERLGVLGDDHLERIRVLSRVRRASEQRE